MARSIGGNHGQGQSAQGHAERPARQARIQEAISGAILRSRLRAAEARTRQDRRCRLDRPTTSITRRRARGKPATEFADPNFELPIEWLETRAKVQAAERQQKNPKSPSRILIVNGSSRNDQTCPGEMSKTWRMVTLAKQAIEKTRGFEVEILDLSRLTSEYGRVIYPCKACVSTAQPLCHWPCSCYPNHALGQTGDWMAEIYPKWVAAHGVMIVYPGQLVPGALLAQADDRPPGLRRRRQSGLHLDRRQGPGKSQGSWN